MIQAFTVEAYRGFQRFELHDLGRVNLLVGTNNCGKTSLLEALQLFFGDQTSLWQVTARRGERWFYNTGAPRARPPEADVRHLFHGHEIGIGSNFRIAVHSDEGDKTLTVTVAEPPGNQVFDHDVGTGTDIDDATDAPMWTLNFDRTGGPADAASFPLSTRGGVRWHPRYAGRRAPVSFISTAGLPVSDIVRMFDAVVLTPEEELLIQALRTIEPDIERLASVSGDQRRNYSYDTERGGIMVKCKHSPQRIPIGSMGDGMWRMLGLALSLVSARNGVLLVDEIDTGFHFTVLEKMWKLMDETSRRLNVQVFATTHSRDAYESLAAISRESVSEGSEVTIQRIDRGKSKSVAFTEQEIVASAERGTEVR